MAVPPMPKNVNIKWIEQQRTAARVSAHQEDRDRYLAEAEAGERERAQFHAFLTWAEGKYGKRNDYEVAGHAPGKALVKGKGPSRKVTPIHVVWQDYCQANGIA